MVAEITCLHALSKSINFVADHVTMSRQVSVRVHNFRSNIVPGTIDQTQRGYYHVICTVDH